MKLKISEDEIKLEKFEQVERGKRIKHIRENELKMNKTQFAKLIGVSGQFLGLVEEGKGNLVYRSIRKLRNLSGHSADYILYGIDDNVINKTQEYLKDYDEFEIIEGLKFLKDFTLFMKNEQQKNS